MKEAIAARFALVEGPAAAARAYLLPVVGASAAREGTLFFWRQRGERGSSVSWSTAVGF